MTPDPDISTLDKLYHSGAWVPLGILLVFLGLRAAKSRVIWLQEDHRAVWVSAILGGLATLIVPATQGTTPNLAMIIGAVVTVASLHADPKKTPAEQKQPQAGFVRVGLMVVIAMLGAMLLFGCSNQARRDTLGATVAVLDTGDATLHTYAHQHTEDLINAPGADAVATAAAVATFRAKVDKIEADIAACYRLVATAGALSDQQSLDNAVALGKAVLAELIALGVVK